MATISQGLLSIGCGGVLGSRATEAPTVVVADVLRALGRLARFHVDRLTRARLSLASQVRWERQRQRTSPRRCWKPRDRPSRRPGSFNNELGLPLTVLETDSSTPAIWYSKWALADKGTSDISVEVAPPDDRGRARRGYRAPRRVREPQAIADSKAELVEASPPTGRRSEPGRRLGDRHGWPNRRAATLWFGRSRGSMSQPSDITADRARSGPPSL